MFQAEGRQGWLTFNLLIYAIATIVSLCAVVFLLNAVYVQPIESVIGIFSELLQYNSNYLEGLISAAAVSTTTKSTMAKRSKGVKDITDNTSNQSLDLVVWGQNLESGLGTKKLLNKLQSQMYELTPPALSVVVALLLSDGWLSLPKTMVNARFGFEQSFSKFQGGQTNFFVGL